MPIRHPLFFTLVAAVIFSVGFFPKLPSWPLVIMLAAVTLLLLYSRHWRLAILIAASAYAIVYGKCLLARQLPPQLDNQSFRIVGVVEGLPQSDERKQRFLLKVDRFHAPDDHELLHSASGLVRLSWYHPSGDRQVHIEPGQRWQLEVKLRRPRGLVNPAGFDYQVHLMSRGIIATGYVRPSAINRRLADNNDSLHIDRWRNHIKSQFLQWRQHGQIAGLLLALAIGERSLITADQWRLLRDTGTIHLMAISGLHIGLAALVGFLLGLLCSRLWQRLFPTSVVSYCFPAICSMMIALLYGLLAGMSLPTQRALIMVFVFHLASLFYRNLSPWLLLSVALVIVAVHDPLATYNQGFWLSFLAVTLLLYGFTGRLDWTVRDVVVKDKSTVTYLSQCLLWPKQVLVRIMRYLKALLWSQWVLALGLLIPSLIWLQGISVSAPFANAIAVPYVSILIVPLLLLTIILTLLAPNVAVEVYRFTEYALAGLIELLQQINQNFSGFVLLPVGELPWVHLLLASVTVIWLLAPRGTPHRYLGILLLLPIILPSRDIPALSITFLDVGQGTAAVIETRNHVLVYDVGPSFGSRFNAGADIVAPYLRHRGHASIDHLVVSHADSDHSGGLSGLMDSIAVEKTSSGETLPISQSVFSCRRGQGWQWDGVYFTFLWPIDANESGNNASCVLMIEYGDRRIVLPGDIEGRVEKELLATGLLPKNVDIIMASHHGSRSSSSPTWINRLSPRWVVVTAGYNNRYGHPHPVVVERYSQQQALLLNTAEQGAIQFTIDRDDDWRVIPWRQHHRRYWYTQ